MGFLRGIAKRPATVILLMCAVVVFGLYSMTNMEMEYFPTLDEPMHVVSVIYPGADADSIERLVIEPIEDAGKGLTGIKNIDSYSYENYGTVMFTYEYGSDLDDLYMELRAELDNIEEDLPAECEKPQIMELSMDEGATITIAAKVHDPEQMHAVIKYVNDEIIPNLESINGVAKVETSGSSEEYLRLVLDETKMQQYHLAISDVAAVIAEADFSLPVGAITTGNQEIGTTVDAEVFWQTDLCNLKLQTRTGAVITIGDVVSVVNLFDEEADSLSRYNGQDSVLIEVTKKTTGSTLSLCKEVEKVMSNYSMEGVEFEVVDSAADDIEGMLMEVLKTLVIGVAFSMLILLIFFGDIRASLIVGSSMPLSLLAAMFLLDMFGISFELMSGTGMIIAIGMLVDNSIVVLESCFRMRDEVEDFKEAAIRGTGAVIMSIVASTITTIVVYVPLVFVNGMAGQVIYSLSCTVIFTMVSSLISAMTVVPTFYHLMKPVEKKKLAINRVLNVLEAGYRKIIPVLLRHARLTILVAVMLFVGSVGLLLTLHMDLFPCTYDGSIEVNVDFRSGTTLDAMDKAMAEIEKVLLEDENFDSVELKIEENSGTIIARCRKNAKRSGPAAVDYYTELFSDVSGMDIVITSKASATGFGSFVTPGDVVEVVIESDEQEKLQEASELVTDALRQVPGVLAVYNDFSKQETNARIVINQQKAVHAGFTPSAIASQVYVLLNGLSVGTIEQAGEEHEVRLEYPEDRYKDAIELMEYPLIAADGSMTVLGDVADIEYCTILQQITRKNDKFTTTIRAITRNTGGYEISDAAKAAAAAVKLPEGVSVVKGTIDEIMEEELLTLTSAIVIAVLLVFLVMAIQFNSPKYSIMVMTCVPFSMIGSFGLMYLKAIPLSMMSLLGLLMMIGMVVNNGILLVDTTNLLKKEMDVREALLQAGLIRLRPIMMTTLTTVLSMVPMILSTDSGMGMMGDMGYVIIGGLCTSTVLALFLMPPFYLIMDGGTKKEKKARKKLNDKLGIEENRNREVEEDEIIVE